ncbi:MAG: DNA pilot protein [Microviridae sp.]|nr:MAG: DNA pilot protein [Microviridae sp.]
MGAIIKAAGQLGMQAAGNAVNGITGAIFGSMNDKRQLRQQDRLNKQQQRYDMEMSNFQREQQMKMWEDTNYSAQVAQLEKAGLSKGLIYGGSGGGGTTANVAPVSVQGAKAAAGGGEMVGMAAQTPLMIQQMKLLDAQAENIKADTENKKADTGLKGSNTASVDLDNALKAMLNSVDENGVSTETGEKLEASKSVGFQKEAQEVKESKAKTEFTIDENARQKLMNDKKIQEIAAKITLMGKEGLKADEITNNLKKDGLIKDAEIAWNKLNLTTGDVGKFITALIHQLLK